MILSLRYHTTGTHDHHTQDSILLLIFVISDCCEIQRKKGHDDRSNQRSVGGGKMNESTISSMVFTEVSKGRGRGYLLF